MNKAVPAATIEGDPHRALVLDAADTVFARLGFRNCSLDDIARAAGVSRACLALHFASKEDVFIAAVDRALDRELEAVPTEVPGDAGMPTDARAAHGHHPPIGSAVMSDIMAACEALVAPLVRDFEKDLATEVAEALAMAGIPARWTDEG